MSLVYDCCNLSLSPPSHLFSHDLLQIASRKEIWQAVLEWSTNHIVFQDVQVAFYILPVGDLLLQEYSDILVSENLYVPHEPAIPLKHQLTALS